jgi:hypothetical protein
LITLLVIIIIALLIIKIKGVTERHLQIRPHIDRTHPDRTLARRRAAADTAQSRVGEEDTKKSGQEYFFLAGECHTITSDQLEKLNASKRSVIAGPLSGTYGVLGPVIGFGKLSRLR